MVGKRKLLLLFIPVLVLIIVLIIVRSLSIKKVTMYSVYEFLDDSDYTLVFSGDYNNDIYKELKQLKTDYGFNVFVTTNTKEEVQSYLEIFANKELELKGNVYVIYNKAGILGYIDDTMNKEEYIKKYLFNYIPVSERYYKEPTSDELKTLYNSKKEAIIVLGDDSCSFCNKLEHVINEISQKNNIEINYVNMSRLSTSEVDKVYDLELTVPGSCTKSGNDMNIRDGYAKPMTLVTKKGKVIGCIRGYFDTDAYLNKLKNILE